MPIASIRNRDSQQALAYIPLLPIPSPSSKKGGFRETKQNRSRNGEATDFLTEIPSTGRVVRLICSTLAISLTPRICLTIVMRLVSFDP